MTPKQSKYLTEHCEQRTGFRPQNMYSQPSKRTIWCCRELAQGAIFIKSMRCVKADSLKCPLHVKFIAQLKEVSG